MTRFELQRTRLYEARVQDRFNQILVTSRIDREAFLDLRPEGMQGSPITVLPNGVDISYYAPNPDIERLPDTIVISGKMSYHANVSMVLNFAENVLPLIWQKRPTVRLCVVGKDPTPEIRKLAENPMIEVTGSVADIRPYLHRSAIAVTPITYGVGIQNKVLEAMACGTPVVSTPQAVSALDSVPGKDVLVASEPADLAHLILDLLADPSRQIALGNSGRTYVETHHQWGTIVEQLEAIYRAAAAKG
jgi:glycosyltransferase involved in cell wall biosynthesis